MTAIGEAYELRGVTVHVQRCDRGYVRIVHGRHVSNGDRLAVHLTGPDDQSVTHLTYPVGYDSRCGWCYLGAPHSAAAHAEKVTP